MIHKQLKNIEQVVLWRLCAGCGVCVIACPEGNIQLVDVPDQGLRPVVTAAKCRECSNCVEFCPGIEISHQSFERQTIPELRKAWGPVLEVWEGYAADRETRFTGSSGGVTTALASFCLETKKAGHVLHIGASKESPLQNAPVFSKSRQELLENNGSRYSPAALCQKFDWIENSEAQSVFIGKPCDVAALRKAQTMNPKLNEKVTLAIGIFCAGTPSTNGTRSILDVMGISPEEVESLRYRGCGWPGMTVVKTKGAVDEPSQMAYDKAWGNILGKHIQLRCRLCPDGTGEFADIACGDPWYRRIDPNELGRSLVLVRTAKGREILKEAIHAGYIRLRRAGLYTVPASQPSLLQKRRQLWGRLLAMRMMQVPTPHFVGFSLFTNWWQLSVLDKIRSVLGTFRRIVLHKWTRPIRYLSGIIELDKNGVSQTPVISQTEES